MKYKAGDKVRIKSLDWYNKNKDKTNEIECDSVYFIPDMTIFCNKIVTISSVWSNTLEVYHIKEDNGRFNWTDEMIEGLAEQGNNMNNIDKLKRISTPAEENWFEIAKEWEREDKEMDKLKHEAILPEGYVFKDENGNIINATKIVMEKKKIYPKTYEECCKILDFCGEYFFTTYEDGIHFPREDNNIYQILKSTSILTKLLICRAAYWKLAGNEMGLGKS